MGREQLAPGVFGTELPGEKFKNGRLSLYLILPGEKETASALAVLPQVLAPPCAEVPDPLQLSRRLYSLYGADLRGSSFMVGPNRVVTLSISCLKNEYALDGADLAGESLSLLCSMLFAPVLENGSFAAQDVAIEKEKQIEYLRAEMNDKRSYALRQARRQLYGDSPLGIESSGYIEDLQSLTPESLFEAYTDLLRRAQIELMVCGADAKAAATLLLRRLAGVQRAPVAPLPNIAFTHSWEQKSYTEPMDTVQDKLCLLYTGGGIDDARVSIVARVASAVLGGMPTSRLFMNVREKQSLCYYCACGPNTYDGTLCIDSGINPGTAEKAEAAIVHELEVLQAAPPTQDELEDAQRAFTSSFQSVRDNAAALEGWAFSELMRGSDLTLDEAAAITASVTREEVQAALAAYKPAVQYLLAGKENA